MKEMVTLNFLRVLFMSVVISGLASNNPTRQYNQGHQQQHEQRMEDL